jgi:hypothetical protein
MGRPLRRVTRVGQFFDTHAVLSVGADGISADRIEPFGHQQNDIIERHPGESRCMVAIRALGESFLQGAAERGHSRGTGAIDQDHD